MELTVEATGVDLDAIASKCALQCLAAHPDSPLEHPWGTVGFHELPRRVHLAEVTKTCSPAMLKLAFGWDMETPGWDGLVCKVAHRPAVILDVARSPVALAWRVVADEAAIKTSRAPVGLFRKAIPRYSVARLTSLRIAKATIDGVSFTVACGEYNAGHKFGGSTGFDTFAYETSQGVVS